MSIFLPAPEIQSYIDPTPFNTQTTGASGSYNTTIVGHHISAGVQYQQSFDFLTGNYIQTQNVQILGFTNNSFPFGQLISPDGKFWGSWGFTPLPNNCFVQADISGTPWVVDSDWGSGENPPTGATNPLSLVYLTKGSDHWLITTHFFGFGSDGITVLRADPPAYPIGNFGFWGHKFTATGVSDYNACVGPQSGSSATAYWTGHPHSVFGSDCALGSTVISAGAESYNPGTWPTPNPDIVSTTIASYTPTDFDVTWSTIATFSGPAYDQTDGNVIITVTTNDSVMNKYYIAKLNTTTGAVMWTIPIVGFPGINDQSICFSRIKNSIFLHYTQTSTWIGTAYIIDTAMGTATTQVYTGVSALNNPISDDVLGCIVGDASWDSSHGSLVLLNSTASSSSANGMTAIYFATPSSGGSGYRRCNPGL